MLPFRKIVFPVDYSDPCANAAPYVKQWVQKSGAQLTLVHAYGPEALGYTELALADPRLPDVVREAEHQRLVKFAASKFPGIHVEVMVGLGEPSSVVHELIQHQQADLLMLPTHGRGPLRRILLGSVTAKLLHDVTTPVWTATPSVLSQPSDACKTILCACSLDDKVEAQALVKAGMALAREHGAILSLVYNVALVPVAVEVDWSGMQKELRETAQVQMREFKAGLGIDVPHRITEGYLPSAVRQEAERVQADLIIVGRGQDQDALGRIWSNLYTIVREAPCPVLSI